jgi:hypothetical protein
MLLDDNKTIFVNRDDIVYVAKGVFHRVIKPTGRERIVETISPGKVARPPMLLLLAAGRSTAKQISSPPQDLKNPRLNSQEWRR